MILVEGRSQLASWEGQEEDQTPGASQHPLFGILGAGSRLCGPLSQLSLLPVRILAWSMLSIAGFPNPHPSRTSAHYQGEGASGEPGVQPSTPQEPFQLEASPTVHHLPHPSLLLMVTARCLQLWGLLFWGVSGVGQGHLSTLTKTSCHVP